MRDKGRSNGVGRVWYNKSTGKWSGSVLLRYDERTEHQLRRTIDADSKDELQEILIRFRETNPPVFMY